MPRLFYAADEGDQECPQDDQKLAEREPADVPSGECKFSYPERGEQGELVINTRAVPVGSPEQLEILAKILPLIPEKDRGEFLRYVYADSEIVPDPPALEREEVGGPESAAVTSDDEDPAVSQQ